MGSVRGPEADEAAPHELGEQDVRPMHDQASHASLDGGLRPKARDPNPES